MYSKNKKIYSRQKGQSAVEMALCLPVLFIIVLGLTVIILALNAYMDYDHALNEAALAGGEQSTSVYDARKVAHAIFKDEMLSSKLPVDQNTLIVEFRDQAGQVNDAAFQPGNTLVVRCEYTWKSPIFGVSLTWDDHAESRIQKYGSK